MQRGPKQAHIIKGIAQGQLISLITDLITFNRIIMGVKTYQIKAILWKNWLIGRRTHEFARQLISVFILGALLVMLQVTGSDQFLSPFYLSMAIIGYSRSVGFSWVSEKETFQKEMQNIMGISYSTYFVSWFIYFFLNAFYVTVIMLAIVKFLVINLSEEFVYSEGYGFEHIVLLYSVYALSTIGFVVFLSSFFSKAKIAAQVLVFLQLIFNFLFFLRFSETYCSSRPLLLLTSIFPSVSFNLGVSLVAFSSPILRTVDYTYSDSLISLLLSFIIYTLLALYLEQVMPNSQGTQKHPLFFIKALCKKSEARRNSQIPLLQASENSTIEHFEPRRGAQDSLINLKSLVKMYGEKAAVDKVTVSFYPNEIFCLLGHNGAGKSTTINLMTGLQSPTAGQIEILGMNYREDKDEIRRNIGLCLQFNVLYENLKIQEHLKFYAYLKGMESAHLQQDIQQIINECSLASQAGKFVKNLSGGNKRKLSLANALIGKSRIIFLDEPSSGLDPNSRQGIWNIIKSIRTPSRCLILTTHHLQQAEELSQNIGIMSNGKMVIVGSSGFIKEKFNIGFHLVLSFREENKGKMDDCRKIITSMVPTAKEDKQTATNTLKFLLNTAETKNFAAIFKKIEPLCQLSVQPSTLEDAFIKLGEENSGEELIAVNDQNLQLPDACCSYSFQRQFRAVFMRKVTTTFRSVSSIVSLILPVFFILLGVGISAYLIPDDQGGSEQIKVFILGYFMTWAFLFNTSSYCGDLVLEREKRFKYLSHVHGLRKLPYWCANYAFDITLFLIPMLVFFAVILAIDFLSDSVKYLLIMLACFSVSFIGYSYMFSFMFQKSSTAFRLFPMFNFLFFFTLPGIIMSILERNNGSTEPTFYTKYIYSLVSPFTAFSACFTTEQLEPYRGSDRFAYYCLSMLVQAIVYPMIVLYMESLRFRLKDRQLINQVEVDEAHQGRGSVLIPEQANPDSEIYISHLYKKYSNGYIAIKDNSFSVQKGEIFGLLGPNGAGKSTTFNIVTAATAKTSGTVNILRQNIDAGIMDIFSEFGVCPQYDSIYENVTTEEHLYYFARVKGIPEAQIQSLVKYYYELLSLTPYIKVKAGKLSGGNKRKLCVSMAMLANPRIMFFDQPSSGVDPISRRFLWKSLYLSARTKEASMVLTTHTMNEAESLCSRIGILIKGQFVCVATPAQLKLKYGKGFRIRAVCEGSKEQELVGEVGKIFGEGVTVERVNQFETLVFTVQNQRFTYGKAYQLFQNNLLEKKTVKRYEIKESTLEEVFLHLSQMQPEPEELNIREPWQCCCWECGAEGCQFLS